MRLAQSVELERCALRNNLVGRRHVEATLEQIGGNAFRVARVGGPSKAAWRGEAQAQKEGATREFVEVVVLEADATRLEAIESVEALLSSPDAQITSRHVLVEDGVPMRFDGAQITARVAPAASHVRLDLVLDAQAVQTTVSVGDGQRTVLPGAEDGKRTTTTLVVPTIVRSEADLRHLYECKKQRAVAG